jgi:hypothetical protein
VRTIAIAGIALWAIAVGVGVREIYAYSTEPGRQATAPETWPDASQLRAPDGRPAIVMFVHPECPCTRASLAELAQVAAHVGDRASITVVAEGPGLGWEAAARIPGAVRVLDPLRTEASRFGARTSGHVVVYDRFGVHRYGGGITGSRGHAGDNVGRRIVESIVDGAPARELAHAVFGCAL